VKCREVSTVVARALNLKARPASALDAFRTATKVSGVPATPVSNCGVGRDDNDDEALAVCAVAPRTVTPTRVTVIRSRPKLR